MSEMGFENVFYLENFECAGDEVLVESSPPPSPAMAARLAQGGPGGASPSAVRDLIVIPEISDPIQLHHIQQVSSSVVEVGGSAASSGASSPAPAQDSRHTYITVAHDCVRVALEISGSMEVPRYRHYYPCEGGNSVNYHVQYVTEPQDMYAHSQNHMETLRTYPVYGVNGTAESSSQDNAWGGASSAEYTAYGVVVAGDEAEAPASPATPSAPAAPRMPPATVQWLLEHYETAEGVSLPRSTLYAHYLRHCAAHRLEPVNAASFGKLIRSVFVGLRTRRLGTRGNSKYHYYGIRAKPGSLHHTHDAIDDKTDVLDQQESRSRSRSRESARSPPLAHRQYLGTVTPPEPPPLHLDPLPDDVTPELLAALATHHREFGVEFLEAVAALDTVGVERARRGFWRRGRRLGRVLARRDAAAWLRQADLQLHQRAVDLLLPDVLRPIPPHLTQAIRNFAKAVEGALAAGGAGAPAAAARAQGSAGAALAAALRRYTSLNHLAQAARAVLTNHHQIHQMLADLNRVDFRVVREQAAWACSCASPHTARKLEQDFKATLGRGASLEQWAEWLERCVRTALAPHEARPDYTKRARRLLLDWSFYSSLVIRELTLRSAASFGSFHLLRLLYDEYVSYVVERRVAAHLAAPPISVMHNAHEEQEEEGELCGEGEMGEVVSPEQMEQMEQAEHSEQVEQHEQHSEEAWEWADEDDEDDHDEPDNKRHKH